MNTKDEVEIKEEEAVVSEEKETDNSFLEINVHDSIRGKDLGPGQQ